MPILRRLAVFLLALLVLQPSLVGAGHACGLSPASGERAGAVGGEALLAGAHDHHAAHGALASDAPATGRDAPREHHDGLSRCPAAVACSGAAVASAAPMLLAATATVSARVLLPSDVAPASVIGAPEPPPPRA